MRLHFVFSAECLSIYYVRRKRPGKYLKVETTQGEMAK